jgi:hypothetical protein
MHRLSRDGLKLAAAIDCLEGAARYLGARWRRMMFPGRMPVRIQDN